MPHRDRATYLRYLRDYHARTRPSPQPVPQANPDLPPLGVLLVDDDGERLQCHSCGKWVAGLDKHARLAHGLSAAAYKERFELPRTASLWSPTYQAKQRAAALERNQHELGRQVLQELPPSPRPAGIPNRLGSRIRASRAERPRTPLPTDHA